MNVPSLGFVWMLALLPLAVQADTFDSASRLCWSYDIQQAGALDGYKIYIDGKQAKLAQKYAQCVFLDGIAWIAGPHTFEVSAYDHTDESPRSVPLVAEYAGSAATGVPAMPTGFRAIRF